MPWNLFSISIVVIIGELGFSLISMLNIISTFQLLKNMDQLILLNVGFPKEFSSVQSSRSIMSDSLRPHESQHTWPPCPSPTPGVHSDSHPSKIAYADYFHIRSYKHKLGKNAAGKMRFILNV